VKIVSFVGGRLLEDAGQEFVDSVRNSANHFSLFKVPVVFTEKRS
jgi:hypothetical protein